MGPRSAAITLGSGNSLRPEAPAATLGDGAPQKTTVVAEICLKIKFVTNGWNSLFCCFFLEGWGKVNMLMFFWENLGSWCLKQWEKTWINETFFFLVLKFSQLIIWKTIVFHQPVQADLSFFLEVLKAALRWRDSCTNAKVPTLHSAWARLDMTPWWEMMRNMMWGGLDFF